VASLTVEHRRQRVVELREQGMSFREIGRTLGVSHELARKDAQAAGLTTLTPVPAGLQTRGQAFWAHATSTFGFDQHEQEVLQQVCRLLDRADSLQAVILADGVMTEDRFGQAKPHPAVGEERQVSLALGRLLSQLEIPGEDEEATLPSPWTRRAQKAARTRWAGHEKRSG
jgi:hypothetical protein